MKLTKRFLAMAIAAFMLLTMAPAMTALAAIPETGGKFDTADEQSWWTGGQDVGQTVVLHYSYSAQSANGESNSIPSGAVLKTAATSTSYKGLINSSGEDHLIAGSGFTSGAAAKKFSAVEGEKVYATVLITRYQNTSEGVVTEEGSELIYMMNGIEVYRENVKNAWFRYRDDKASWTGFATLGDENTFDYCPDDAENEDKLKYSWFYGVTGTLDAEGIASLMDSYNAALTVNPEYTDVKITGNGVDGKIISNLGMEFIGSLTVADLKQRLVASNENVSIEVYASGDAEEAMAEDATVSEGAVVKTVSSNGFTKLTYAVSEGEDPINMTWSATGTGSAVYDKVFGREQADGETVLIRYNYNAYGANESGSQLAGIMLNTTGQWSGMVCLFNSNSETHYAKSNGGNANGSFYFPAVEGEDVQVAAFVTRNGSGSSVMLYVNGVRVDGLSAMNYENDYIGGSWKYLAVWARNNENSYFDAEVKSLGILDEQELIAETSKYVASVAPKAGVDDIGVMANGTGGLNISAFKLNYTSDMTVGELKEKIAASEGVTYDVYASAAAEAPLEDSAAVETGMVIKSVSANGFTTLTYTLTKYENAIAFTEDSNGNTVATVNNLFALDNSKLYIAAYSTVNGSLQLESVKTTDLKSARNLTVSLPKATADGKVIKAFYWNQNLVPIAAATK